MQMLSRTESKMTLLAPINMNHYMNRVVRKPVFAYAKTKTQISFAVTAKLIIAFVFATRIVESFFFLNPKFQASSHLLWLYRPVCVRPGRKPQRPVFSQRGSYYNEYYYDEKKIESSRNIKLLLLTRKALSSWILPAALLKYSSYL